MKILLIGEYSNVHWTLAEGLRELGHQVTVISNGDFWKNYKRDISICQGKGTAGKLRFLWQLATALPRMRGYDIVQLINPMFIEMKAEKLFPIYRYIKRNNRRVVLGAFGMDYYWVNECCTRKPLRYSDFNTGNALRTNTDAEKEKADWLGTAKERLNRLIAEEADAIVSGLYEYDVCYRPNFPRKTHFIPYPIRPAARLSTEQRNTGKVRFFIGINRSRSEYKGTDIMLRALNDVAERHPDLCEVIKAENVPFAQYEQMMLSSDCILDQLYSYTPAMNALQAMAKGIVCIGGGEEENYSILNENELRPIINVEPTYESVVEQLEQLVLNQDRIDQLKKESIEYIARHHDYIKVARQYEQLYNSLMHNR